MADAHVFTVDWFSKSALIWKKLLHTHGPNRILEIGSYEGRASCFLIDQIASKRPMELHCVDTWEGGAEHNAKGMPAVEARFDANVAISMAAAPYPVDFHKHKELSSVALTKLLSQGASESFDFVYVDGSHQAPDVLADAILAFMLLKVGGVLIFDDYLWMMPGTHVQDYYHLPKPAIDAFVNIYQRKLRVIQAPLYQLYARKVAS